MGSLALFVAGILVGLAVQTAVAKNEVVVGLNHVGLSVPSIPEAAAFYTQTMGFREAFRNTNEQGQPTSIYLQMSKNTFLELQQSNAQRPAGINHYGLHVENARAAVAMFRQRGANVTDLNGLRIELSELGPDSLQRKAMDSWKP